MAGSSNSSNGPWCVAGGVSPRGGLLHSLLPSLRPLWGKVENVPKEEPERQVFDTHQYLPGHNLHDFVSRIKEITINFQYVEITIFQRCSVGATIGAVSAKHVTESLGELESTVNTALTDVGNYLDGGAQVHRVMSCMVNCVECHPSKCSSWLMISLVCLRLTC